MRQPLAELTFPEIGDLDLDRAVAILPVGAVEAHGPHLPVSTDGIIADAMASAGRARLEEDGIPALVLPRLDYTAAPFAAGFAGTISLRPETVSAVICDIGCSLARSGWGYLALANAHFDPTHLGSLYSGVKSLADQMPELRVVFPDVTRKPWALRLTDEFKSGACHAGRYEGSIVMAARPDLVREEERLNLAPHPVSLSRAIRDGHNSFESAGGTQAYFGAPAEASSSEGEDTVAILGAILAEAVLEIARPSRS